MARHRKTVDALANPDTRTVRELQEKAAQAKAERAQKGGRK